LENFEMKKTLVAVAALVATGAFAQVTIFGLVDLAAQKATGLDVTMSHQYAPSHIGFKGSEDLGSGMKANFLISTQAPLATGGVGGGWESYVGLSGGFGDFKTGQFFNPSFMHNATYNLTGQSGFGGSNVGLLNEHGQLTARQIQYTLPALVPGLSAAISLSAGADAVAQSTTKGTGAAAKNIYVDAADEVGDNTDFSLGYSVAGFSVGFASNTSTTEANAKTTSTGLGASYDFGMAKVAYNGTTSKAGTATSATGSSIGISVPFGAATLAYESSSAKDKDGVKSTGSLIQAKYDLSKRTFAMIQVAAKKIGTAKTDTTGVGLVHTF
jgi:predicted porin